MNSSLLSSIADSHHLNPTTTVVRALPIIADAWEDAAISQSNESNDTHSEQETYESRPKPSIEFQTNFMKGLQEIKGNLRPTLTETKCGIKMEISDIEDEQGDDDTPSLEEHSFSSPSGDVEHLSPDYGWSEAHGFRGAENWELPIKIKHCEMEARPGYSSKLAHEYADTPEVLRAKVSLLAKLMLKSSNCLLYTGAGISTASGIGDYATRSVDDSSNVSRPRLRSPYEAQPTYAHRSLVALYHAGLIHYWVQQNHDGLPQKAGLPQHAINEIHGAWYDPSNPVVSMSGNLRSDLFTELLNWEKKSDLTVAVGTSMCGMNSDRVFTTVANKGRKSLHQKKYAKSLGGVIINRQQTQFDHLSCLRIFADIDDVMKLLLMELNLAKVKADIDHIMVPSVPHFFQPDTSRGRTDTPDVFSIPYDSNGLLNTSSCSTLDVREGSTVRLTGGPYEGDEGTVLGKNREGHLRIQFRHLVGKTRRPFESVLGSWWLQSAVLGDVPLLPIVNCKQNSDITT